MINYRRILPLALVAVLGGLAYVYSGPLLDSQPVPFKVVSHDGPYRKVQFFNQVSPYKESDDTVAVLSSVGNSQSYGKDKTIADLYKTIGSFDFNPNQMSLGLLIGDTAEFDAVLRFFMDSFAQLSATNYAQFPHKVTLLSAPFIEESFKAIDRNNRHSDSVQRLRRRNIAKSRNFVLNHSLDVEKYTLFIDADIVQIEHPTMLRSFINSNKDIVVPRIVRGGLVDYDRNSWQGERTAPNDEQYAKMDSNDWDHWDYVPRDVPGKMTHFDTVLNANKDKDLSDPARALDYVFPLDSVGGAILFAKSVIYQQGIQFPPNYIIGTTWNRLEGFDGIETEGLCYIAKSSGYTCWGMPNLVAHHSSD